MENYEKEPSQIEHEVEPETSPFDAPQYFHIEVLKDKGARNIANKVLRVFGPGKPIVLYAVARATSVAVSCAEIIKNFHKNVHQVTRLGQIRTIETWQTVAAGLDPLKVTRSVPMIHILLSLEPVEDEQQLGYQKSSGRRKEVVRTLRVSELNAMTLEDPYYCGSNPTSPLPSRVDRW